MPAIQTSYATAMPPGIEGMPADVWSTRSRENRICEETSLGFGLAVVEGVNARGCKLGAGNFIGLTMIDPTLLARQGQVQDKYLNGSNTGIMLEGDIWVRVISAVTHGQGATYHPDGRVDAQGAMTTDTIPVAYPALVGARFLQSGLAGALVLLRLMGSP
jgi:hypothetical protein